MDDKVADAAIPFDPTTAGAAAPALWLHRSTHEVSAGDRFEFCRGLAMGSHVERPLGPQLDFFGEFTSTTASDGTGFAEIDIDPCVSRFGPGGDDSMVDIGMLGAGIMHVRYGRDDRLVLDRSAGPVLFDPARPMTIWASRTAFAILRLPRIAVVAAIGDDAVPRRSAVRPLYAGVLTAELAACLHGLTRAAERYAPAAGMTLDTARALALVNLARFRGAQHHWPGELGVALYRAACHAIAIRVADPRLTSDAVAKVLGCSRAQLYRVFATQGETVAKHLYEARMRYATALLRKWPATAIGTIAFRCGYAEPAAFDKAFRHRFGMTPRDWRAAVATSAIPG